MLGNYGSPAAESALWQRYVSWNEQLTGRESQLERMFADGIDENVYQLGLGQNLTQALATSPAWLSDKNKLQRLLQQTKVPRIQQQLEGYLKIWENQPLTIVLDPGSSHVEFHARLAQYEFHSMEALKAKLTQFPSDTKIYLVAASGESSANDQIFIELRTFLNSHRLLLAGEKRGN